MYNGTGYPVRAVSQLREESRDGSRMEREGHRSTLGLRNKQQCWAGQLGLKVYQRLGRGRPSKREER